MTNFKQLMTDLSNICYEHQQVNSFGFGTLDQITNDIETRKAPLYPKVFCVPEGVTLNQGELQYQLSIIVMDRLNNDLSNQVDVMSDTLEIAKDIFTVFNLSYTPKNGDFTREYEATFGDTLTAFLEEYDDVLGGWTLNVTISQPFDYNRCNVPTNPFTHRTWSELNELWNEINTDWNDV